METQRLRHKQHQAEKLLNTLVIVDPKITMRSDRYYRVLRLYQAVKKALNNKLDEANNQNKIPYAIDLTEHNRAVRENMVTSTTYIRAQKRLNKEVNDFLRKKF